MKYKRDKVVDAVEIPGLTLLLLVEKNTNNGSIDQNGSSHSAKFVKQ